MSNILTKVYLFDAQQIVLNGNQRITTIDSKDLAEVLPAEIINPRFTQNSYQTLVLVIPNDALTETLTRVRRKIKTAYVCPGSQMIPGGGTDQGIYTNESPLYLASSYNLCLERLDKAYPLEYNYVIFSPNVLVFRDHKQNKYPMLQEGTGVRIAVINSAPKYRPLTNLTDADQYHMDARLYAPTTTFREPHLTKATNQLRYIFNTALFFGYDTVVIDDRGVDDFWLPAHHMAQIMAMVINQYKGRFREIVVAIDKPHLFNIYKKYIS